MLCDMHVSCPTETTSTTQSSTGTVFLKHCLWGQTCCLGIECCRWCSKLNLLPACVLLSAAFSLWREDFTDFHLWVRLCVCVCCQQYVISTHAARFNGRQFRVIDFQLISGVKEGKRGTTNINLANYNFVQQAQFWLYMCWRSHHHRALSSCCILAVCWRFPLRYRWCCYSTSSTCASTQSQSVTLTCALSLTLAILSFNSMFPSPLGPFFAVCQCKHTLPRLRLVTWHYLSAA